MKEGAFIRFSFLLWFTVLYRLAFSPSNSAFFWNNSKLQKTWTCLLFEFYANHQRISIKWEQIGAFVLFPLRRNLSERRLSSEQALTDQSNLHRSSVTLCPQGKNDEGCVLKEWVIRFKWLQICKLFVAQGVTRHGDEFCSFKVSFK